MATFISINHTDLFGNLFGNVCNAFYPEWLQLTGGGHQTDHEERIRGVLPLFSTWDISKILEQPTFKPKDAKQSAQRRRDGDRLADKGDQAGALERLNQAVMLAPPKGADPKSDGGLQLALALWSRSDVLLKLGNGQGALSDLLYAKECGLMTAKPETPYYLRLSWAHALSGDKAKAHVCFALAERLCKNPDFRFALASVRDRIDEIECEPKADDPKEPALTGGAHPLLGGASSLLDIRTAAGPAGRHAIAGRPIGAGDTLLVERPLVACLLSERNRTHCLHCMRSLGAPPVAPVPYACDTCTTVAFCSPACQRIACATYHRYECRFPDLVVESDAPLKMCCMALRAVTQCASVAEALPRCRQLAAELCGHETERRPLERLRCSVMAVFFTKLLQKSGFMGAARPRPRPSPPPPADREPAIGADELQVAAVLLGLLEVLQFNMHAIFESQLGRDHWLDGLQPVHIGIGLYRTGALFNHDCHPSVEKRFVGRTLVLTAIRPLRTGEAVGENYGPTYSQDARDERQLELQAKFMFRCECRSCVEDWPLLADLDSRPKLRCPTASCAALHAFPAIPGKPVNCRKCRKLVDLWDSVLQVRQCEHQYHSAMVLAMGNSTREAVAVFAKAIDQFYEVAVPPHLGTQHAQTAMQACLDLQGTVVAAPDP